MLLVDTRTNEMILLEGRLQDDDRDTTNGDLSEEENLDYTCSVTRPLEDKSHIVKTSGGAPLPSPEEESKWQQLPSSFPLPLPLPLPLQDDLMSTSFVTERECCSQDEDEEEEEEEMEEEEDEDGEEDEDNSSSSGEFVWKVCRFKNNMALNISCFFFLPKSRSKLMSYRGITSYTSSRYESKVL